MRRVLALRGHALESTAATVLCAERLNRRMANVVVFAEGDHNGSLFDEVLTVHGQRHGVNERTSLVAVSVHKFGQFILQNREAPRTRCQDILQVSNNQLQLLMLVLDLGNIKAAQLVQAAFGDGFGLRFAEIERVDAGHGFLATEHVLELLAAGTRLADSDDVVNAVLGFDQTLQDVGSGFGFVQVKHSTALNHGFAVRNVGVNHRGKVEQHRASVKNAHHVGRVGLLEPTGFEQLIEYGVGVGVVFDFNDHADALFGRFITDVTNANDDFLVDQISNLNEHVGFLDLVGDLMDHDALAFFIVKHLALGSNVESTLAGGVHVGDAIDAVDGGAGGKVRAFHVLHVFFYRDGRLLTRPRLKDGVNVQIHSACHFREVVRRDASRHTHCNTVAAVEQQVRQSSREHRGFILRVVKVGLEINGIFVDVIKHVFGDAVKTTFRVPHGGRRIPVD